MTQYPHNSRTLDCWQCYKANGKMCTMRNGKSNLPITGSSNTGHGLCCKHDSTGSECNTGTEVICSQPVPKANTITKYVPILSKDMTNHQIFAFCPIQKTSACGQSSLVSNATVQNFTAVGTLGQVAGSPKDRKYDACYYEISSISAQYLKFDDLKDGLRVYVRVNQNKNMNVYIYGGSSRMNATQWIMFGDAPQVEVGRNYTFPIEQGMLLIAYPTQNTTAADTSFDFQYWVQPYKNSWVDTIWFQNFTGSFGQTVLIVMIVIFVIICLICCSICYCFYKAASNKKYQVGIYELGQNTTNNNISDNNLETHDNDGIDDENLQVGSVRPNKSRKASKKNQDIESESEERQEKKSKDKKSKDKSKKKKKSRD